MKGNRFLPAGVFALGLAVAACHSAPEPAAVLESPRPQAAAPVVEDKRPFAPPADGRLALEQVEKYRTVQRRSAELAGEVKVASGPGASIDPTALTAQVAAEVRAVEELGLDPVEHRWVREQVAQASPVSAEPLTGVAALVEKATRESRAKLVRQEASARGGPTPTPTPSTVEWNRKVVAQVR